MLDKIMSRRSCIYLDMVQHTWYCLRKQKKVGMSINAALIYEILNYIKYVYTSINLTNMHIHCSSNLKQDPTSRTCERNRGLDP